MKTRKPQKWQQLSFRIYMEFQKIKWKIYFEFYEYTHKQNKNNI